MGREGRAHGLGACALALREPEITTLAVKHDGADLVVLKDYIEAGKITPVIGRTYELREVPDAIRDLEQRRTQGKSVVIV